MKIHKNVFLAAKIGIQNLDGGKINFFIYHFTTMFL